MGLRNRRQGDLEAAPSVRARFAGGSWASLAVDSSVTGTVRSRASSQLWTRALESCILGFKVGTGHR
jgi:hypothetical protein